MIPSARPQEILLPVTGALVAATLVAALVLNLIPWPAMAMRLRPDLCALALIYWGMHQPRGIGFTVAFLLGLAMDIADANLLGQHALAYVVVLYGAIALHRRVLKFSLAAQTLHVAPLLVAVEAIAVLARIVAGAQWPGWTVLVGPLIASLLWVPLCLLLRLPRVPKPGADRV